MKKILFVLTCLFCSAAMMASITVTGTVISAEDGLPVIGASVLEILFIIYPLPHKHTYTR